MILNRVWTLTVALSLAFGLIGVANAQMERQMDRPENSLRRASQPAAETSIALNSLVDFSSIFDANNVSKIQFELRSGAIADAVITDQQLADVAFAFALNDAYGDGVRRHAPHGQDAEITYDDQVRPAAYNDASSDRFAENGETDGEGFSAFSNVEVATFDSAAPVDDSSAEKNQPILAEAMPEQLSPALPQPQNKSQPEPQSVQTPFGPALPADFAFNQPISQQWIGDLLEEIQRQKDLLKSSSDEVSEEHSRRVRLLEESQNTLLQAKKFSKKDFVQRNAIKTFEFDKKILQEKLSVDRKPQLPQGAESAADLFSHLEGLRHDMDGLNTRLHDLNKKELQHKVRLGEIPKDRASSRKRFTELDKLLKNEELGEADTFVMIRLRAEELELEYRIESLESESKLYELENRLLPLNGDLLAREVKILETEIEAWNYAANERRRLDLEEEARLARAQVIETAPALRILAELNAELTERRIKFSQQVRAATDEEIKVHELLSSVRSQHETVEKSIIDSSHSQANGMLLVDIRRTMIRPFKSQQRIRQINRELQKIGLERIKLNEQREPLSHPAEYAAEMLKGVHSNSISDEELSVMAVEIVESIRQQYDQLSSDHHTYTDLLGKIVAEREELVREIEATLQFVNQHSLWVRSAQPIGVEQLTKSRYALSKFFSPASWMQLLGDLTERCFTSPHESAAGLIGLVGLFIFSRRFKA